MEFEFTALEKYGEEAEWLHYLLEDILRWPKHVPLICMHYDVNFLLVEHKAICIIVSLDIFVVDTIPSNNYSRSRLSL